MNKNQISVRRLMYYLAQSNMPIQIFIEILKWDMIIKSPYSLSFYSAPTNWGLKEDKIFRVSDHWNFFTHGEIHCKSDKKVPPSFWALGIYNKEKEMFQILKVIPAGKKLIREKDFQLTGLNINYDETIKKNPLHVPEINFSFLKRYYKILEQT